MFWKAKLRLIFVRSSRHNIEHYHPNRGQISVYSKALSTDDIDSEIRYRLGKVDYSDKKVFGPDAINLLNSKMISSYELTHIGWFSDHFKWEESYQCFNNRWTLCDKVCLILVYF